HDVNGWFPPGGMMAFYPPGTPGVCAPPWNINWNVDKGGGHVYLLPYMEQSAAFNKIPNLYDATTPSIVAAADPTITNPPVPPNRLPYMRCPSDNTVPDAYTSNFMG